MRYESAPKLELVRFWQSAYARVFTGCVVTLLAMAAYDLLPKKKRLLVPAEDVQTYIYVDEKNAVEWLNYEALRWRCQVQELHTSAYCGFNIDFTAANPEGVDLSRYTHVNLDLEYTGEAKRLRFYFRNYEPGFSDPGDMQSAKFNQANIPVEFVGDRLTLHMDEFYVAEWWSQAYNLPRRLASPAFDNVLAFGVDLLYPADFGNHDFQVHRVEFVGAWVTRDQWYAGLLLFWIFALALVGVVKFIQLRRSMTLERQRLEAVQAQAARLESQSEKYRVLSQVDELTGLLNRHGLSEHVSREFSPGSNRDLCLLLLDIDHFKGVNDRLGHDPGDRILKELGQLMSKHVRQTDYAARWGGEEFVLLLTDTHLADAHGIAEKLRLLVAEHDFEALPGESLTVSIGVGCRHSDEGYHELFRRVDKALYRAKGLGRNCSVMAEE